MILTILYSIAAAVVFLDLLTKHLVKSSEFLVNGGTVDIIPGVFRLKYVENSGAAMGSFADARAVFMILSAVAIIGIIVFSVLYRSRLTIPDAVCIGLIIGGGIGNMYERLFNTNADGVNVVTDFLDFCMFPNLWKWVFNLADAAITCGAVMFILLFVLREIRAVRQEKLEKEYLAGCDVHPRVALVNILSAVISMKSTENTPYKDGAGSGQEADDSQAVDAESAAVSPEGCDDIADGGEGTPEGCDDTADGDEEGRPEGCDDTADGDEEGRPEGCDDIADGDEDTQGELLPEFDRYTDPEGDYTASNPDEEEHGEDHGAFDHSDEHEAW